MSCLRSRGISLDLTYLIMDPLAIVVLLLSFHFHLSCEVWLVIVVGSGGGDGADGGAPTRKAACMRGPPLCRAGIATWDLGIHLQNQQLVLQTSLSNDPSIRFATCTCLQYQYHYQHQYQSIIGNSTTHYHTRCLIHTSTSPKRWTWP
jgi:hypothetical protein